MMPNTENAENTEAAFANAPHVVNMEQTRQSPEPYWGRHSSASLSLARFDASTHRTLRNSTSLVENISSRIEGLRPLVERYPRISSFFNIQQRNRHEGATTSNTNDSYIINLEEDAAGSSRVAEDRTCSQHNNHTSRRGTETFTAEAGASSENPETGHNDTTNEEPAPEGATSPPAGVTPEAPADDGNNNSDESSIAENVSTSEELPLNPEIRALLLMIKSYLPYVLILTAKIVYDHVEGIINLLLCLLTFIKVNNDLKREIAKQQNRSWLTLLRILCQIAACFFVVSVVFGEEIFISFYQEPVTMLELLWSVAIMDFALKLITVALKVLLTCLPTGLLAIPKRGKYYLLVEATSQVYRCTVPIKPWLSYLFKAYNGPEMIFSILLSFAYAISKTSDIFSRISLFWTAVSKLLQNMSLGVAPSKEQLVASGGVCTICHEEYSTPVRLTCKHIFCESCVSTWLDRERSCPLCRAAISDDPIYRDGHTTHFIQLY